MKQETKSGIELIIIGLLTFLLGFLFFKNKKQTQNDSAERNNYDEKDMI